MNEKTFLILGGYGNTGQALARLLLQETNVRLVLAGRNRAKAEKEASQLNLFWGGGDRVRGIGLDASNPAELEKAFEAVDFVIVASSTASQAEQIAIAALKAGIDYLDIQYSTAKLKALEALAGQIEAAERCFITEAGFHPGLPAALVRYAGSKFCSLERANVSSVVNLGGTLPQSMSTLYEFVEEFKNYEGYLFKAGRWHSVSGSSTKDMRKVDFGGEYGQQYCAPMGLSEMRRLPDLFPSLQETGFYIADTNRLVSWIIFPVIMVGLKLSRGKAVKPLGKLLYWAYKTFDRPPYGVAMKVEAHGEKARNPEDLEITLSHEDGYMFTAIPVMACLLQYLDGTARKPGLWMMGHLVEPERFVQDLERLGAKIRIREITEFSSAHVLL